MGIHSGKFGAVNGISTVRNWQIGETSDVKVFAASNTKGGTGRRRGNRDWSGNIAHYGGLPLVLPGEEFNFAGFTSPDDDVSGNGVRWYGPAICESVNINWNWETAEIINSVINFAANGALARDTTEITDTSNVDAPSPIGAGVRIIPSGSSSAGELCPVVSAALTLTTPAKPYANSCTAGQMKRKLGNLDWTLALVLHENDPDDLPYAIDDFVGIQIDIDDTGSNYWEMIYALVQDFSNIVTDIETGNIIQMTSNFGMAADDAEGNIGTISLPGGTQYWPTP